MQLKERGLHYGSQFEDKSILVGMAWWQECEMPGHAVFPVRKQRETDAGTQLVVSFPLLLSWDCDTHWRWILLSWDCDTHLRWISLVSYSSQKVPHQHGKMILNPVILQDFTIIDVLQSLSGESQAVCLVYSLPHTTMPFDCIVPASTHICTGALKFTPQSRLFLSPANFAFSLKHDCPWHIPSQICLKLS